MSEPGKVAARQPDQIEQSKRLTEVERWLAERKPRQWMEAEAFRLWGIVPRTLRKLTLRVQRSYAAEKAAARPFEREQLLMTMETIIERCLAANTAADREVARKTVRDMGRFLGYDVGGAGSQPIAGPTINVGGNVTVDMRTLSPIERQQRLAELYRKRIAAGLPVDAPAPIAPAPQNVIDVEPADEADDDDDYEDEDE